MLRGVIETEVEESVIVKVYSGKMMGGVDGDEVG